jgi:hypothetical protein
MIFCVGFAELRIGHVCIDLSRRDRCVTEKFLDYTDISTICQQSCRKRVPECVGVHILEYARPESVCFYHVGDKKSREAYIRIIEERRVDISFAEVVSDEEGSEVIVSSTQILEYAIAGELSEIDGPELITLAPDCELEGLEIDVMDIERCEL